MDNTKYNFDISKIIVSILFFIVVYFALSLLYFPIILKLCNEYNCKIIDDFQANIRLLSLIFDIFISLTWGLILSKKVVPFIQVLLFFGVLSFTFFLQLLIIKPNTQPLISSYIAIEFPVSYRNVFVLPTIAIVPILFKEIFAFFSLTEKSTSISYFKNLKFDIRLLRFFAIMIDISLILIISIIFSKYILLIVPETSITIVFMTVLYIFSLENTFNSTIGKSLFGIKIKSSIGDDISGFQILIRTFCRFIPFYPLPILFNKKGLHEYLSNTFANQTINHQKPSITTIIVK